jgi:hypothetical protein
MKKQLMILPLVFLLCFTFGCQKQEQVERFMEDGVEVVANHLEPYKISGEPRSLILEEMFTIDTERDDILEIGLINIGGFDIDSEGKIYIFSDTWKDKNLVYKFDKDGNFIKKFGKIGQGPGEIQGPWYTYITNKDEIPVLSESSRKLFIFNREGIPIQEYSLEIGQSGFEHFPLENGNFLKHGGFLDRSTKHNYDVLKLFNSNLVEIKELDRCDYGLMPRLATKIELTVYVFIWQVLNERIFVGHENRGYEILIYDLDGKLLKKIRKEYTPADVPDEVKERYRELLKSDRRFVLPDKISPFHYFFLDDVGRLYVKTFEKGLNDTEYIHDIFNSDGVFILRKSMPGYARWTSPGNSVNRAKAKNGRFYCIRERESGYKELVIYKMTWD